jgi:hypothetical protein
MNAPPWVIRWMGGAAARGGRGGNVFGGRRIEQGIDRPVPGRDGDPRRVGDGFRGELQVGRGVLEAEQNGEDRLERPGGQGRAPGDLGIVAQHWGHLAVAPGRFTTPSWVSMPRMSSPNQPSLILPPVTV